DRNATAASSSARNVSSSTPIADARHSGFAPILARREGGCKILRAHFSASGPSSNAATPSRKAIDNVPPRALTLVISLTGMFSFRSPPRNCRTSVSSRALPSADCPLNRAVTRPSAPITRLLQQRRARTRRKALDRIAQRRPRNRRTVRAQIALQPRHVGLARFAQRPSDRLVNQIFAVRVQPLRDVVDEIERRTAPRERNQSDHRGAPHPP